MSYPTGHHPGAVWLKVDFQCHTPRDRGWMGSPKLAGGTQALEENRDLWADAFVAEAFRRGLGAVAVTDHHDITFLRYVLEAADRAAPIKKFIIFPGIEITCADNVQCLAIFEPGTTANHWSRLLAKLDNVVETSSEAATTDEIKQCGLAIEKLFEVVSADETLATRVMLIPHFSNANSHKSLNAEGFAGRFAGLPCDGVYIECPHGSLDQSALDKIQGRTEQWGRRRRAILATGDNRNANWNRFGAHDCWIRLGEPTIEAIRQAFLADEARLVYSSPVFPTNRIVKIEIKSSLTGEDPLVVTINDGFTALIGGRGSGKSAVLEFLRFGLGKSEVDITSEETFGRKPRQRERSLVEETLHDGWVAVELDRGGLCERWTRSGNSPALISVTSAAGDEVITVPDAQRRFPARAFHQKELSTTMVDPLAAAENITGIAAAEVIEERRRIDTEIAAVKREVTTALQDLAAHWQAELELVRARGRTADIRRRLATARERMAQGGIQESDLEILREAPKYGQARTYLEDVQRHISDDRDRIQSIKEWILTIDKARYGEALTFLPLSEFDLNLTAKRLDIRGRLKSIQQELNLLSTACNQVEEAFGIIRSEFEVRYARSRERQVAHAVLIKESENLVKQLEEAEIQESRSLERRNATIAAPVGLQNSREKLANLVVERRELLARAAEEVAGKSAGTLMARVAKDRNPAECIQALCTWMEGSMIRNSDRGCADWVQDICGDSGQGWQTICEAVLKIYRDKLMAGSPGEPGADAVGELKALVFGDAITITDNQANRLYNRLSDQTVEVMLSAVPRDSIVMTYVSEGQRISFARASPGQQASALLELLLRQEAGTLIVDQPEDDLDNRVIMRIVERIRTSKTSRQVIFATHNANLVVNGDADKVVTMEATAAEDRVPHTAGCVRVEVDGAIETPAIREAVTRIMEGGLEAFDLRARKYGVDGAQR